MGKNSKAWPSINRQQIIRIPAYRGEIYLSKQHKKIAKNTIAFSLFIVPNSFPSYKKERERWEAMVKKVARDFDITTNKIIPC